MADSEHSELISEFCKVTGQDVNRARMYLEANGWKSDLAISSYFEEAEEDPEGELMDQLPTAASFPRAGSPKPVSVPHTGASRIATIASLANNDDTDEEEGQAFYAGGSERSGQQVIGPGKRKAGNEVVEEMFKAVRKFGGEVMDPGSKQGQTTKLKAFRGAGFVLGSTPDASPSAAASDASAGGQNPPREIEIRLRLWRTGFTVNDQPLRDYNAPESKAFLESVRKGEVPAELMGQGGEGEIHLNIEDHSHEEYVPRRVAVQAFSGTGFRLGNIAPAVTITAKPSEKNAADAQESLKLDESQASTTIQIRLADGSRLIMKANHSHTVGDVRRFIVSARPEFSASVFSLMTAYPTKELDDDEATLEQENLLNSVIVQKMK